MRIIGWDIGGAHLKAAFGNGGAVSRIIAVPCPLWRGMDRLERALEGILSSLDGVEGHRVTMSGEMCDLFPSRAAGVRGISRWLERRFPDTPIRLYAAGKGMVSPAAGRRWWSRVASANWHLSAGLLARLLDKGESALLLDIGSTTSDIIPVEAGLDPPILSDFQRLGNRWLHYGGVIRTPLQTICPEMTYGDEELPMMAENFADMADVYRILGRLGKDHDLLPSADGRPKTRAASLRRLGRMIGLDRPDPALLTRAARRLADLQRSQMTTIIRRFIENGERRSIVGAGCGRFLAREIAADLRLPYEDFGTRASRRFSCPPNAVSDHAPAAALILWD